MHALTWMLTAALHLTGVAGGPAQGWPEVRQEGPRKALVAGNNAFALDLYARVGSGKGNQFFSPYSISTALAMTYAGARGRTAEQMARVLHFKLEPNRLHAAFKALMEDLNTAGEKGGFHLSVANALWAQKGYTFIPEFLELIESNCQAGFSELDFMRAAEPARQIINRWVEQRTQQKIENLISPGLLNPETTLVLTNAIYFKGNWAHPFKREKTRPGPFTLIDGKRRAVPMMHRTGSYGYREESDYQVLELLYAGYRLSMVILLPRQADGLARLYENLTVGKLDQCLQQLSEQNVMVSLPKFRLICQYKLGKILPAMGMNDAFSGSADFSGMTGRAELFISEVVHKAFVEVNEEGTEAAAATGVIKARSLSPAFVADHPFLFLIRDRSSGSILFIGRVMEPGRPSS